MFSVFSDFSSSDSSLEVLLTVGGTFSGSFADFCSFADFSISLLASFEFLLESLALSDSLTRDSDSERNCYSKLDGQKNWDFYVQLQ